VLILAAWLLGLIKVSALSGSYRPGGGLLSGLNIYLLPIFTFIVTSSPKSLRCLSYCPGSGDYSLGRLCGETSSVILATRDLGFVYELAASGSYIPGGGFVSGLKTYFDPIVTAF